MSDSHFVNLATLIAAGVSIVPIKNGEKYPDASLLPDGEWKVFMERLPTMEELQTWVKHTESFGTVAGKVSGNLEILDFDTYHKPGTYKAWKEMLSDEAHEWLQKIPVVETRSGGYHLRYRTVTPPKGNEKLYEDKDEKTGARSTVIETRGEGGQALVPPSPGYKLIKGLLSVIPVIPDEVREEFFLAAKSFNHPQEEDMWRQPALNTPVKRRETGVGEEFRQNTTKDTSTRPGDDFGAKMSWDEILGPHGWQRAFQRGKDGVVTWRRPGKGKRGISATSGWDERDVLYVFSSNADPFEPDCGYTKFTAYALLNHDGNFKLAAKTLGEMGYGDVKEKKPEPSSIISQLTNTVTDKAVVLPAHEVAESQELDASQKFSTGMKVFDDALLGGFSLGNLIVAAGRSGVGKCLGPEVEVLHYDGRVTYAKDVKTGDTLMGPDSQPRKVLSTTKGFGKMYNIVPKKGSPWRCNDIHVLTLSNIISKEVVDVPLDVYDGWSGKKKGLHKLFTPDFVDFHAQTEINIDPYLIGLWFGDGTKSLHNFSISKPDIEVKNHLKKVAKEYGLRVVNSNANFPNKCPTWRIVGTKGRGGNPLLEEFRGIVGDGKTVPQEILTSSREERKRFLAGFIDADGYLVNNTYEIVQKNEAYAWAIAYVARSLGLRVTQRQKYVNGSPYVRMFISGDINILPVKIVRKAAKRRKQIKNARHVGFSVEYDKEDDYVGFTLDGDGRFLLGDFTVTHNTTLIQNWTITRTTRDNKTPALWFTYEVLARALWEKFESMGAVSDTPIYFPSFNETGDIEWVLEMIEEGIQKYGVKFVAIDHLGFLRPPKSEEYANNADAITKTVRTLKQYAVKRQIMVTLPVHVRKTGNKNLDLDDVKDSVGIVQEADSVFFIDRMRDDSSGLYKEQSVVRLQKNRETGASCVGVFNFSGNLFTFNEEETTRMQEGEAQAASAKKAWHEIGAEGESVLVEEIPQKPKKEKPEPTKNKPVKGHKESDSGSVDVVLEKYKDDDTILSALKDFG